MKAGSKLAQSVHCAFAFSQEHSEATKKWMTNSNYICILECKDEIELNDILNKAKNLNIKHSIFIEPDYDDSLTAIALDSGKLSKKLCSNLKLALKNL